MEVQDPTPEQFPLVDFNTFRIREAYDHNEYHTDLKHEVDRIAGSEEELQKLIPYGEMLELTKLKDAQWRIRERCSVAAKLIVDEKYADGRAIEKQAYDQLSEAVRMREDYILRGIPETFASVMKSMSWERSHSYGQYEVLLTLKEMADEFRPVIIQFEKDRSFSLVLHKERSSKDGEPNEGEETDWSSSVEIKGVVGVEQIYRDITRIHFKDKESTDDAILRTGWEKWDDRCLEIGFQGTHVFILGENDNHRRYFTDWQIETNIRI